MLEEINYLKLSLDRKLRKLCKKIIDVAAEDGTLNNVSGETFTLIEYRYDDRWLTAAVATKGYQTTITVPVERIREPRQPQQNNLLDLPSNPS